MSIITDILKELPLSAVLRERLAQAETRMAELETENAALKAENAALKEQKANLEVDLQKAREEIQAKQTLKHPGAWGSAPRIGGRM